MCFTETHLDCSIADSDFTTEPNNSTMYGQDRSSHSGGLRTYVSNNLCSKRRFDLEQPTIHAIWIEVKYCSTSFLLFNIYRSPGTPVAFWSNFNIAIEKALESNKT